MLAEIAYARPGKLMGVPLNLVRPASSAECVPGRL
jgi:hypothetical protein